MSFLEKSFEVAVLFSAVDRLTAPMERMAVQMGMVDRRAQEVQERLNRFKNMAFIGGAITLAGIGLAKALEPGIEKAAEMETTLTSLGITTGATAKQLKELKNAAMDISMPTIYTQSDVLKNMQILGAGGINDIERLKEATKFATNLAEVTELQTHGAVTPEETVKNFLGMAHQFNLQTPEQMKPFADMVAKLQLTSTAKIPQMAETLKYAAPYMNLLGGTPEDALKSTALMSRMGIEGSMAGTHLKNFYERLTPGLMRGGMANEEMYRLGWLNDARVHYTKQGKLKVDSWSGDIFHDKKGAALPFAEIMNRLIKSTEAKHLQYQDLLRPMVHIFGQQGADVAAILSSQTGRESMKAIMGSTKKMPGLDEQIAKYRGTYEGQMHVLHSNLENLNTMIGDNLKNSLVGILTPLNSVLTKMVQFGKAHPEVVKFVASFAGIATAVMLIVGPLMLFTGAIGYLRTSGMVLTWLRLVGSGFVGLAKPAMFLFRIFQTVGYETLGRLSMFLQRVVPLVGRFGLTLLRVGAQALIAGARMAAAWLIGLGPIGWIILGVSAIITAAIVAWNTNFMGFRDKVTAIWAYIKDWAIKSWDAIVNKVRSVIEWFKTAFSWLKKIFSTSEAGPGGSSATNVGNVPGYASGTSYHPGGFAWVGERGPELVNLPRGSQVISNDRLGGGGDTYNITINAAPGQSEDAIADAVIRKLGRKGRNISFTRPTQPVMAW